MDDNTQKIVDAMVALDIEEIRMFIRVLKRELEKIDKESKCQNLGTSLGH